MTPFFFASILLLASHSDSFYQALAQLIDNSILTYTDDDFGPRSRLQGLVTVGCRNGAELAAATANQTVQVIVLLSSVTLTASDFALYSLPIVVTRNVTVTGPSPNEGDWPVLDQGFLHAVVRLPPGVIFSMKWVVMRNYRDGPIWQAPGMDFVAPSDPAAANQTLALVTSGLAGIARYYNASIVYSVCLPRSMGAASTDVIPRVPGFPGAHREWLLPPQDPATCDNSSSAPGDMRRCWPQRGLHKDVVVFALNIDEYERTLLAGYVIQMRDAYYLCETVMTEQCVKELNPVGCYRSLFPKGSVNIQPPTDPTKGAQVEGPVEVWTAAKLAASNAVDDGKPGVAVIAGAISGSVGLVVVGLLLLVLLVRWKQRHVVASESVVMRAQGGSEGQVRNREKQCAITLAGTDPNTASSSAGPTPTTPSLSTPQVPCSKDLELEMTALTLGTPLLPSLNLSITLHESIAITSKNLAQNPADDDAFKGAAPNRNIDMSQERICDDPVAADDTAEGNEVRLLPTTLGAGSFGRVVVGMYRGQRVAVKLLKMGLVPSLPMTSDNFGDSWFASEGEGAKAAPAPADAAGNEKQPPQPLAASDNCERYGAELASLVQEVEVLGRCRHPNIVRLLAASLEPAQVCLVMELMDISLEKLMYGRYNGQMMPLPQVLFIGLQIARALAYLHPTVLHRDLKPANVLISKPDSDKPVAKLADFGLSRLLSTVLVTKNPATGTAPYMAPETFHVQTKAITDRSDIYSLGVILFELLSGARPWEHLTMLQIAVAVTVRGVKLPLDNMPDERCPRKLRLLIWSCWEYDPARRPAAAEVVKRLGLLQQELGFM